MDKPNKLIFYPEWYNMIRVQPDSIRLALYDAIMQYKYEGIETTDPAITLVFCLIKQQIDKDEQNYDEVCERNRLNGCKGGAPKGNQNARKQPKTTENNQAVEKTTQTTETSQYNNNCNSNINNNITSLTKANDVSQTKVSDAAISINYNGIVQYWNTLVQKRALKAITGIKEGSTRRTLVQARIKEYGKDMFAEALRRAAASDFLNGGGRNGQIYGFDWIIRPNNFPKVLEGNYDNDEKPQERPQAENWAAPSAGELALRRQREFAAQQAAQRAQQSK